VSRDWWEDEPGFGTPEQKADWDAVLQAFGGEDLSGPGWARAACPRCRDVGGKDDQRTALGYNPANGRYSCFRCEMKGWLPDEYRKRLHDGDVPDPVAPEDRPVLPVEPAHGYVPAFEEPGWSSQSLEWARSYLLDKRKGLGPQALYEAGVGAAMSGPLAGRVIVPLPDYAAPGLPWRGWVARDAMGLNPQMPYRYSKGLRRDGYLYNAPALQVVTDVPVFVVEGTLDALALWPDAVAVLGKPIESQVELLATRTRPVVMALDGDAWIEGQALAWKLQHLGAKAGSIRLKPREDPDEVGKERLLEMAAEALDDSTPF
jgi:hypothetical protein